MSGAADQSRLSNGTLLPRKCTSFEWTVLISVFWLHIAFLKWPLIGSLMTFVFAIVMEEQKFLKVFVLL